MIAIRPSHFRLCGSRSAMARSMGETISAIITPKTSGTSTGVIACSASPVTRAPRAPDQRISGSSRAAASVGIGRGPVGRIRHHGAESCDLRKPAGSRTAAAASSRRRPVLGVCRLLGAAVPRRVVARPVRISRPSALPPPSKRAAHEEIIDQHCSVPRSWAAGHASGVGHRQLRHVAGERAISGVVPRKTANDDAGVASVSHLLRRVGERLSSGTAAKGRGLFRLVPRGPRPEAAARSPDQPQPRPRLPPPRDGPVRNGAPRSRHRQVPFPDRRAVRPRTIKKKKKKKKKKGPRARRPHRAAPLPADRAGPRPRTSRRAWPDPGSAGSGRGRASGRAFLGGPVRHQRLRPAGSTISRNSTSARTAPVRSSA